MRDTFLSEWLRKLRLIFSELHAMMRLNAAFKVRVAGGWQRDPHELAPYHDPRVKATQDEIARQLHGNWQADGVFRLKQELQAYIAFVKP
jgi:hypothetical protein